MEELIGQHMKAQTGLQAIIYVRVSTDEQADKGYSLPTQLEACRNYAARLGLTVVAEFQEDCSGAIPFAERPEGKKVAMLLKRRDADAIIAYQVDRLSRDIVDLLAGVRDWLRSGIQVHAGDVGKIESELDIVLVIKGWQGSDERKKIIERCSRGRLGKAKSGKVVGNGTPPYGYRYTDGNLEIIESEAKIIRLVYQWYTLGDEDKKPLTAWKIAERLSQLRIETPAQRCKTRRRRVRPVWIWNYTFVLRMLSNETYAGVWYFGERIGKDGKGGFRPKDEQITVPVPAIVDRASWDLAQARREYNKRMSPRNAKEPYLLRKMVKCGECQYVMSGNTLKTKKKVHRYYRCSRSYFRNMGEDRCVKVRIHADALEEIVWNYVLGVVKNAKKFERALRKAQKEELESLEPKRELLTTLLEQISETEKEASEIGEALKRVPRGGVVEKNLMADMQRVEKLYAERIERREKLQEELGSIKYTEEKIKAAMQFRENVALGMENATFEDKRHNLEILNTEVVIKDRKAVVKCLIPAKPGEFDLHTFQNAAQAKPHPSHNGETPRPVGHTSRRAPSCAASA